MHSFLKAVGFGSLVKESEIEDLLEKVYKEFDHRDAAKTEKGAFLEMEKYFGPNMGLKVRGILDTDGFHRLEYFPFYKGTGVTIKEDISVEPRVNGSSFAGVCEDGRVGISMIFYIQNASEYLNEQILPKFLNSNTSVTMSGLAGSGMILLPVVNREESEETQKLSFTNRNKLVSAARNGDQEAMESLTIEDMDIYSMLSRRVAREDIYSIVNTFFMPFGIECDLYQIMGNITAYQKVRNPVTKEYVYQMSIECNDMNFDVCINEQDLIGSPDVGLRFKGIIWLQGKLNFEEKTS